MLYYLLKNPATMRTLQKEIDELARKKKISDPVTYQEACKMPYLQAVMKEAMRFVACRLTDLIDCIPRRV
jgi:cytochrome P450